MVNHASRRRRHCCCLFMMLSAIVGVCVSFYFFLLSDYIPRWSILPEWIYDNMPPLVRDLGDIITGEKREGSWAWLGTDSGGWRRGQMGIRSHSILRNSPSERVARERRQWRGFGPRNKVKWKGGFGCSDEKGDATSVRMEAPKRCKELLALTISPCWATSNPLRSCHASSIPGEAGVSQDRIHDARRCGRKKVPGAHSVFGSEILLEGRDSWSLV